MVVQGLSAIRRLGYDEKPSCLCCRALTLIGVHITSQKASACAYGLSVCACGFLQIFVDNTVIGQVGIHLKVILTSQYLLDMCIFSIIGSKI